jgi:hypothetical protein
VRVDSLVHMFPLLMNDVPTGTSLNVIFFDIVNAFTLASFW